jgi:hypothetical protein
MAAAETWAATIAGPAYAIDDATAITVTDDTVEVVSEGQWRHFPSWTTDLVRTPRPAGSPRRDGPG